jgi:hypothetical protein
MMRTAAEPNRSISTAASGVAMVSARGAVLVSLLGGTLLLAGCEKAQISQPATKKPDIAAYQGTDNAFAQKDWKRGDQASWEQQMRNRSQGQNEYSRTSQP